MEQLKPLAGLRIEKDNIIQLEKGKIPPQALDLEEVVLGAMMIDKKGVDEVGNALATRELMADLRAYGVGGGPPPFDARDRSRFLQALELAVRESHRSRSA